MSCMSIEFIYDRWYVISIHIIKPFMNLTYTFLVSVM